MTLLLRSNSLQEWAQSCFEPRSISFQGPGVELRGLPTARSAVAIQAIIGLSASFLSLISSVTLECGMWIVNQFRR